MHRKILGICLGLVAIGVLAIPAMASAAVTLREGTTTLPVGTKITALQDESEAGANESIFEASGSKVVCTKNSMTGEVTTNNGGNLIEGNIEKASFKGTESEERCAGGIFGATKVTIPALEAGTAKWCLKNVAGTDTFEVVPHVCGGTGGAFTFRLDGALLTCTYTRTAAVTGTFTTNSTPATLAVTGNPEFTLEEGVGCPSIGKITKMKFQLYTDNANKEGLSIVNEA